MRRSIWLVALALPLVSLFFIGCSKDHPCESVPVSEDWEGLGVPLEGGITCLSDEAGMTLHHTGEPLDWVPTYVEHLEAQGWAREGQNLAEGNETFVFVKDDQRISISFYEYEGAGIRIDRR